MEVKDYSITTDASSMDMSNMFTGVGQISAQINETPNTRYMLSREFTLTDFVGVEHIALVQQISARNGDVSLVAEDTVRRFNVDRWMNTFPQFPSDVPAITGILEALCIEVDVAYDIRYTPSDRTEDGSIMFPGGKINLWDTLKELAAIHRIDMWVEGQTVIFDNLNQDRVEVTDVLTEGWSADISNVANWVEVIWYEPTIENYWEQDLEFYPRGNNEEAQILQADAGETVEVELDVNAWVTSVNQPSCVEWVDNETYDDTMGVYSVVGNDNLPIMPSQWLGNGGDLKVELTDDSSIVRVILKGANLPELAPFRIAMSSGNHYNSLHLTGWCMPWVERTTKVYTGAGSELTSQENGAQIETRHIQDLSRAYDVAYRVARAYAGPNLQMEADTLDGVKVGTTIKTPEANFRVEQRVANPTTVQLRTGEATTFEDFNEVWGEGVGASYIYEWEGAQNNSVSVAKRNGTIYAKNLCKDPKPAVGGMRTIASLDASVSYPQSGNSPSQQVFRVDITEDYGYYQGITQRLFAPEPDKTYTFSWWLAYGQPLRHGTRLLLRGVRADGSFVGAFSLLDSSPHNTVEETKFGSPLGQVYRRTFEDLYHTWSNVIGYGITLYTEYEYARQSISLGAFTISEGDTAIDWFDGDTPDTGGSGPPTFTDFNYDFSGMLYQDFATGPLRRING